MKWIPVSKQLPTHPFSVLGYVVSGGLARAGDPMRDIVCYFPDKGVWQQNVGDDDEVVEVTHWMPLPAAPAD